MTYRFPPEDIKIFIESLVEYGQLLNNYNKKGNTEIKKEIEKINFLTNYLNENKESYFLEFHNESLEIIKATLIALSEKLLEEKNKQVLNGEPNEAIEGLNRKILNIQKIVNEYKCFKNIRQNKYVTKEKYKEYLDEWNSREKESILLLLDAKLKLLPLISTIAVAVLAFLSINKELIADLFLFKISMIIFICLIPLSLWLTFLTINYNLNNLIENDPIPFSSFNTENIKSSLKQIKDKSSATKVFKSMFKNLKSRHFQEFKTDFWRLAYGIAPFFLIIILTIAFFLFALSLSFNFKINL